MAKKAKLDLLEEKLEEEVKIDTPDPHAGEQEAGARWFTRGRILAIILASVTVMGAAGFSMWFYPRGKKAHTVPAAALQRSVSLSAATGGGKEEVASLKGFVIAVKDRQGGYRTLICDVALAFRNSPGDLKNLEQRRDIRNLIYTAVRSRGIALLDSPDEKNLLRREVSEKLNAILGGNSVAAVYFTEFVLL